MDSPISYLLGLGLNIHRSFVSRSSQEKKLLKQNDICMMENKSVQPSKVKEASAQGASDFFLNRESRKNNKCESGRTLF